MSNRDGRRFRAVLLLCLVPHSGQELFHDAWSNTLSPQSRRSRLGVLIATEQVLVRTTFDLSALRACPSHLHFGTASIQDFKQESATFACRVYGSQSLRSPGKRARTNKRGMSHHFCSKFLVLITDSCTARRARGAASTWVLN